MTPEIQCSRTDCDFHYLGRCGYGGSAVRISEAGCLTYEPAVGEQEGECAGMRKEATEPCSFTDQEFKDRMLHSDSDTLADFLGRDFLIFGGNGDVTGAIDVKEEINAAFAQMPKEEIDKFWLQMQCVSDDE